MFWATSHREFGGATLRSTVFLERRLRVHLVRRDRLVFDTRYAAPARVPQPFVHLFAQLSGTLWLRGSERTTAPCAFVLAETEFDRVVGDAITFRSFGARCTIVEIRVPAADVRRPIGLGHGAIALEPVAWDAYRALEADPGEPAVHDLLATLATAGVLQPGLTASVVTDEPERFVRVWAVLRPMYENLSASVSLKQLASFAGLSLRQLGRDLTEFTHAFRLFGGGFRDATRILRLRTAVLLLSAPEGSPAQVARLVGYSSLDAMGRAFRDAELPAPSLVHAAVRYRDDE